MGGVIINPELNGQVPGWPVCFFCGKTYPPPYTKEGAGVDWSEYERNWWKRYFCGADCYDRLLQEKPELFRGSLWERDIKLQLYLHHLEDDPELLWAYSRKRALERANFRCQQCGATDSLQVHHIEPLDSSEREYPTVSEKNQLTNLMVLYLPCHRRPGLHKRKTH